MANLALLPGLHGTDALFEPILKTLPAQVSTATVAYPDDPTQSYAALAAEVASQLPDGPIALLAESFAGPLALTLARQRPQQVTRLIFAGSFVANPQPVLLSLLERLPIATLMRLPLPNWIIRLFAVGFPADDELCALVRSAVRSTSRATLAHRVRMIAELPRSTGEPLDIPTLYLRGTRDILVPPWAIGHCRGVLPNLTVHRLACPHLTLQARPAEAAAAITAFMGYDL